MIFTNLAEKNSISKEDYQTYLKLVFPIFPHVAEELWSQNGGEGLIVESSWPEQIEIDLSKEQKIISSRKKSPAACTVLIFFFKPYARKWYQD